METVVVFLPAAAAGLLVVATHVPLGREVLRSGIVFLDLAIAQAAGFGVILVGVRMAIPQGAPLLQIVAVATALAAAALLTWTERRAGALQEALIGTLFVLTATAALLALASNPHAGEHLHELLVGQILWVTWSAVVPVAVLYAAVLVLVGVDVLRWRMAFYAVFAITVTASVQLVGVYLVFATLIIPALATHGLVSRIAIPVAYGVGGGGYIGGFVLAMVLDLPAGAVIVWTLAGMGLLVGLVRGRLASIA